MRSIRLSDDIERRLDQLSERENRTKSDLIKEAIVEYLTDREVKQSPYDLGADLFGVYSSDEGDLSTTYKTRIIEILREKNAR
jgi:predicted transcriptional regulator